jgi:hypothetical protein
MRLYTGDSAPRSRSDSVRWWIILTDELDEAIAQALHIDADLFNAEPVHEADQLALRIEAWHLKPSQGNRERLAVARTPAEVRCAGEASPRRECGGFCDPPGRN